jgi:hypothetical protein
MSYGDLFDSDRSPDLPSAWLQRKTASQTTRTSLYEMAAAACPRFGISIHQCGDQVLAR